MTEIVEPEGGLEIVGNVDEGWFYQARDGSTIGPMLKDPDDDRYGSFKVAFRRHDPERWWHDGWHSNGNRDRDLVRRLHRAEHS